MKVFFYAILLSIIISIFLLNETNTLENKSNKELPSLNNRIKHLYNKSYNANYDRNYIYKFLIYNKQGSTFEYEFRSGIGDTLDDAFNLNQSFNLFAFGVFFNSSKSCFYKIKPVIKEVKFFKQ